MKNRHILTDPAQVKALATPVRRRIIEILAARPMTTKQVADALGEPPTRLYHHVAALERIGLIEPVEERRKRGTVERYYRPIAQEFVVDRRLFSAAPTDESDAQREIQALFTDALEETQEEICRNVAAKLRNAEEVGSAAMLGRVRVRGSREQIHGILDRLRALMTELRSAVYAEGDVEYGLTVAFYQVEDRTTEERRETGDGDRG